MTRSYHTSTIDCQKQMAVKSGEIPLTIHPLKATFHSSVSTNENVYSKIATLSFRIN